MKQILTIIILAALACSVQAQTSAVTVNSAGKIVVPANGTITSTGTITGNNITCNGTLTTVGANITGNISTTGTIGTTTIWRNLAGSIVNYYDIAPAAGAGLIFQENTVDKFQFVISGGTTYLDYYGAMFFRNNFGGTSSLVLPDASGVQIGASGNAIQAIYSSSASIDFANTSAQTTNSGNTITVTGVTTTDTPSVQIGLSAALPTGCSVHGIVTSSNTVTLYFVNASASAQDPGAITIRATVTGF